MDNATIAAIVTCLITGLLSAGGWKFYEAVLRQKADQRKEEKNEKYKYTDIPTLINEAEKNIYNLCNKVQAYTKEKYLHKEAVKAFGYSSAVLEQMEGSLVKAIGKVLFGCLTRH